MALCFFSLRGQVGASSLHSPSLPHVLSKEPFTKKPVLQLYSALSPTVKRDTVTWPLMGSSSDGHITTALRTANTQYSRVHTGGYRRCYGALRNLLFCSSCDALSNGMLFLPESKCSDYGQKPWTIVHGFDRTSFCTHTCNSSLEGAIKLKFAPFCSS